MAMPIAMHTRDLPWVISISICMGCRTTALTLSWYGTDHTEIARLPEQNALDGRKQLGGSYFFDNGYLIYLAMPISSGDPDYAMAIYKIQLETGEITRLFQEDIPVHTDWPSAGVTYAEGNLETGRIEHVFEDWNQSNSPMVNFDNVLYYHRVNGITFFPQEPPYLLTIPIYWEIKLYRLQRLL